MISENQVVCEHCPYCGERIMLCSECPVRDDKASCDWRSDAMRSEEAVCFWDNKFPPVQKSEQQEISELKAENAELKRLLRLAVQGFKYIDKYFGCAGCKENWQDCPYNAGKIDVCTERWNYADEAEKVKKYNCKHDNYSIFD